MELVNWVDLLSLFIIVVSILLSYSRGFLRECFTILAWIFSAILSIKIGPEIVPFMVKTPFLEEFFLGNCPLTMLVSFVLTFVISLTIFSLFIPFISPKLSTDGERSFLSTFDKMAGIIFGFGRSIIILIFLMICVQDLLSSLYISSNIKQEIETSLSNKLLLPSKVLIKEEISNGASIWLNETYELILKNECGGKLNN